MTDLDPEYVAARGVLLDALEVLAEHRNAIVLVGAQAVYLRTESLPGYQPYTTDADLTIDPSLLAARPGLEDAMRGAGFRLKNEDTGHPEPGIWEARVSIAQRHEDLVVPVDLIVPEAVAPPGGRRGARLGGEHADGPPAGPLGWKVPWSITPRSRLPLSTERIHGASPSTLQGLRRCCWPRSTRSATAPSGRIGLWTRTPAMSFASSCPPHPSA